MTSVSAESRASTRWWGPSHRLRGRDLIGKSAPMQALRRLMHAFAPYDVPLLLEGEEGTGKRFVAQIVHSLSPFRAGPFIAVDCSAWSDTMLAVELFGCAPGFGLGLAQVLPGKVELAWGGTLLLERVERLPMWIQKRLLQIVETRSVTRMGGGKSIPIHVRILASMTTCPSRPAPGPSRIGLTDYLSGGFPLSLPPLRERRGDISLLNGHFLALANREFGKQIEGFNPAARAALEAHSWPGNLRELSGAIRSAVLAADRVIGPGHLPPYLLALQSGSVEEGRPDSHA